MAEGVSHPARLSALASVSATREVLERFGLSTKKALGQHFLINDGVVRRICNLAQVCADDIVLEIGPGIGTLTLGLLACGAHVVAIERDADLIPVLESTCADFKGMFNVLNRDALVAVPHEAPVVPNKLVANLPYAVAATLVLDVFAHWDSVESATVMLQSEVADRITAVPGTKEYGAFTVKLGLYTKPHGSFRVAPGNFFPPPRVDSTVIRLDRINRGLDPYLVKAACIMADAAFTTRRKTIVNSCCTYFASRGMSIDVASILGAAGIDSGRRGETLALEEYITLGQQALEQGIFDCSSDTDVVR